MSDAELAVTAPRIRRRVIGSNVWLLSFGDLVTLLLGFFVAIIAYAMQNPPKPPPAVPPQEAYSGTTLAVIPAKDAEVTVRRTVILPEEAFDSESGELLDKWRNMLKMNINAEEIRITESSIFGCVGDLKGGLEQHRFAVMGRTLAVTGQVLDMGAPSNALQVETPGEVCEAGISPGAVRVTVTGTQKR